MFELEPFKEIQHKKLLSALNELGRLINLITTYGLEHPVVDQESDDTVDAMNKLFKEVDRLVIGAFNGNLTVNEVPVDASNTLLKSLERRLRRLHITGLRLSRGITKDEIIQIASLMACNEPELFTTGLEKAGLSHVSPDATRYEAVHEGEAVLSGDGDGCGDGSGNGVHTLDDPSHEYNLDDENSGGVHVDQIVAFLKGDVEAESVSSELTEAAADPERLGQLIMESVSVRQSMSDLQGESLGDIVLGCLRRTYTGLRKQSAFQSSEGKTNLRQALLMLEESVLEKMRGFAGEANPELDRQIVQAIREMDDSLGFELAAQKFVDHKAAIEESRLQLEEFVQEHGTNAAESLIGKTEFPRSEWRRIVVESNRKTIEAQSSVADGINTLATVFEKLENLMKSEKTDGDQVKDLLGQANLNIGGTLTSTREKLNTLSKQLGEDTGTIGGQAKGMDRKELLSSISEVAQELMQPLTAIHASLEMMLGGYVGDVSEEQRDMLGLAANSSEHLKFLMNELIEIVGCPENMGIDPRFHTTSDEVIRKCS